MYTCQIEPLRIIKTQQKISKYAKIQQVYSDVRLYVGFFSIYIRKNKSTCNIEYSCWIIVYLSFSRSLHYEQQFPLL